MLIFAEDLLRFFACQGTEVGNYCRKIYTMFYAPLLKVFFCCQVFSNQYPELIHEVTLERLDPIQKRRWPSDQNRPVPVIGRRISAKENRLQEFVSREECEQSGFDFLGLSNCFPIYLDWDAYLKEKPMAFVDENKKREERSK